MPKIEVLKKPYGVLWFDEEKQLLHHEVHGNITGENWKELLNRGIEFIEKHQLKKWVSDNRNIPALDTADTVWINNDWLPRAVGLGWKYWALVLPTDVIAQINMQEFIAPFNEQGVRVMVFTMPEEAIEWIDSTDQ